MDLDLFSRPVWTCIELFECLPPLSLSPWCCHCFDIGEKLHVYARRPGALRFPLPHIATGVGLTLRTALADRTRVRLRPRVRRLTKAVTEEGWLISKAVHTKGLAHLGCPSAPGRSSAVRVRLWA